MDALVDIGETRAIGDHPAGGAWWVGLEDPASPGQVLDRIELIDWGCGHFRWIRN